MTQVSDALLQGMIERLQGLPPSELSKLEAAYKADVGRVWKPDPDNKPQQAAYACKADLLLYGGAAGGGKTDLLLGTALTSAKQSVIFRRAYVDLRGIEDRLIEIIGTREGYNGADKKLRYRGRVLEFGALEKPGSELGWQGRPHDFIGFDEGAQLLEEKVRFVLGWLRTTSDQKCRAVIASNPPMGAEGDWLIRWFAPWLDDTFPDPARPGELRWCCTRADGSIAWVDGPGEHEIEGEKLLALSRTYIPARLSDNRFLKDDYRAQIMSQPEPLRSKLLHGDFLAGRKDAEWQVIPTAWIDAAMQRWTAGGHKDFAMTVMALDPAGGGRDSAELCWRHGPWFAEFISAKGAETADGSASAATVIRYRRDNAPIVVDVGGGYGGAVTLRLKDNGVTHTAFNGANNSMSHTRDGKLKFANKRAEAWWKFREELDPDQQGGSAIALPPDTELKADLAAPTFEVTARGILIESKDEIRKRLGRSPGKGDAAVMCLSEGNAAVRKHLGVSSMPKVITAYGKVKRRH